MQTRHNPALSRYELIDGGEVVGVAEYQVDGDVVVFPHTEITPSRRGQGLGEILVKAALDDVRETGRTIVPACWFVAEFVRANPAYHDLLAA